MRNDPEVRQQMFEIIDRWKQSGLSQKSFCENESIKPYVFYYWYRRYRIFHQSDGDESGFVKLNIGKPVSSAPVEIHFPKGVRLLFHEPVSADYLKSLIS